MSAKDLFIAREGYQLMEFDYSQIEVIALAELSGCMALRTALKEGYDLHCLLLADITGRGYVDVLSDYEDGDDDVVQQRKNIKQMTFQLQYGAYPKGIAKSNGITIARAKEFYNRYYKTYPGVKTYHEEILGEVEANASGGVSYITSITGRKYKFESEERAWGTQFPVPKIKNYPVQGLATGDIVPTMVGIMVKILGQYELLNYGVLPIATVYDSILFEVREDYTSTLANIGFSVLEESLPSVLLDLYNINTDLPYKVDCHSGDNWGNLNKQHSRS